MSTYTYLYLYQQQQPQQHQYLYPSQTTLIYNLPNTSTTTNRTIYRVDTVPRLVSPSSSSLLRG